jgi:nitrogen fixation protein FixH
VFGANFIMVRAATVTFGGVETDSSYKAGLAFKREISLAHAQDNRGWKVDASLRHLGGGGTQIEVTTRDAQGLPIPRLDIALTLAHPTDRRLDRVVSTDEIATGRFKGSAEVPPGQWELVIELVQNSERMFRSQNRVTVQ